jgi:aminoglycoside phosphotransferase (APT) family kinase protein
MSTPAPDLLDAVRAIALGVMEPGETVTGIEPMQVRRDAAVMLVATEKRRLVVKVAGPRSEHRIAFERTATITALAQRAGAPVPEILAADDSFRRSRWRYLVAEHIDGIPWRDVRPRLTSNQVVDAHRQIATALLAVQSVCLPAFGELDVSARPPAEQGVLAALHGRAVLRIRNERDRASFRQLLDREAGLFAADDVATLAHDDLHHGNVLFRPEEDGWRLVGLLDWDKAWAGPAESDVARMMFWDYMTGPGFWEVYQAHVPTREGAARRALIYQLLWCLEYDDGSPRHAADTIRLRHRLSV